MYFCDFAITEVNDDRIDVYACELGHNGCKGCADRTNSNKELDSHSYKCPTCGDLVDGYCATCGDDVPF